jgi:uncharacterized protein (DUF362 family)
MATNTQSEVFLIKTTDREAAVKSLMERFDLAAFSGKHVALKANFNSADPFPASTHLDTLQAVVEKLKQAGAAEVTLGERSGIGNTKSVLDKMGVFALSNKLGFNAAVLNEIVKEGWEKIGRKGTHWLQGFCIAKLFTTADKVVQTCCLKTHAFGGHFTLSLKNSVGLVARKLPGAIYDYMWELHGSPYQRQMIAEINKHYKTDLVVMDGIKAFVDGGPQIGKEVQPNLMLASTDRVAIDAVGVAILRSYGSTNHVMNCRIFELDQIKRAAELDIGAQSPDQIKLIPLDDASSEPANRITDILKREG